MDVELTERTFTLKSPLVTAHGETTVRRIIEVQVRDGDHVGDGEAAPLAGFGLESYDDALAELRRWAELADPAHELPATPSAAAAVSSALASLDAASEGISLAQLLTGQPPEAASEMSADRPAGRLAVHALISDVGAQAAAHAAIAAADDGYLAVKLKLGVVDAGTDAVRIASVRRALPAAVALRLDANGAWGLPTATKVLRKVSHMDIDFIEEPTRQPADWAQLIRRAGIAVAIDEHLTDRDALTEAMDAHAVEVAVIKPATVGGPQAAYDLACLASVRGVRPVITSFLCGPVGLRIAREVALAVSPGAIHGVGTAVLFDDELPADVTPVGGYLTAS